jgi:predicted esterase
MVGSHADRVLQHPNRTSSMENSRQGTWLASLIFTLLLAIPAGPALFAQETKEDAELADVPSQDLHAGDDEDKRYFLIGPRAKSSPPADGFKLLIVLPGGSGDDQFLPFVKRISKYALPAEYLVAQPVAKKWTADQQIVWPTSKNHVAEMKFTTEEFIDAVIDDVAGRHKLDRNHCRTLSWSSSGPAAYAAALSSDKITGSFIAMSVFNPNLLPGLEAAKGRPFFLYHSPDDRVCPYRMAVQAKNLLKENGAAVDLKEYRGGHGWRGGLYDDIRAGINWLEKNQPAESPKK